MATKKRATRSERRAAFPRRGSPTARKAAARTTTTETPFSLRTIGVEVDPTDREYIRQRLGFKLGKFALETRRVSARLVDESGPKGPPSLVCRIRVVLEAVPAVVVEHAAPELRAAIDGAVERAERGTRRALQRLRSRRR